MMSNGTRPTDRIIANGGLCRLVVVTAGAVAIVATTGCFGIGSGTPSAKPSLESSAALPGAEAGDPSALHRSFHAAYAEEMRPYPNQGETSREISDNLDSILVTLGDKTFADALP